MRIVMWVVLAALFGGSIAAEFTLLAGYDSHWWNSVPVFYGLWGGLAAFVLIGVSFLLGRLLKKDAEYYDD